MQTWLQNTGLNVDVHKDINLLLTKTGEQLFFQYGNQQKERKRKYGCTNIKRCVCLICKHYDDNCNNIVSKAAAFATELVNATFA